MRSARSAICGCLVLTLGTRGFASAASAPIAAPQSLLVEVWINDLNSNVDARLVNRDGHWWASLSDLAEAGVNLSKATTADHGLVALAKLDGIVAEIDQPDQRLLIKARADCLAPQRIDLLRWETKNLVVRALGSSCYWITTALTFGRSAAPEVN